MQSHCFAKKIHPGIIITQKFNYAFDKEKFAFHYLLLSGCWRSEEEMRAGMSSWMEALEYHGIIPPHSPEEDVISPLFIRMIIESNRYNIIEIKRLLTLMISQGIDYGNITQTLNSLKNIQNEDKINSIVQSILEYRDAILNQNQPLVSFDLPNHIYRDYIHIDFNEEEIAKANQDLNNAFPLINSNIDQLRVFNYIKESIRNGTQSLLYINGKAGTGKSFLIKFITNYLICTNIPSTGKAASLIDGQTAHSAFAIYTTPENNSVSSVRIQSQRGLAMSKIKFLIIDEITMLSKSTLDCIDNILKTLSNAVHNPNHDNPFGGCSVILFGDMAQVPAVSRLNDDYQEARFQFNNISCWNYFQIYTLDRVVRQNPDQYQLIKILDSIRNYSSNNMLNAEILDGRV